MNKRQLQKILSESAFSPNKPSPLKVIADVGDNNDYYIRRAMEFLTLSLCESTKEQTDYYLKQAISLLAIARVRLQNGEL